MYRIKLCRVKKSLMGRKWVGSSLLIGFSGPSSLFIFMGLNLLNYEIISTCSYNFDSMTFIGSCSVSITWLPFLPLFPWQQVQLFRLVIHKIILALWHTCQHGSLYLKCILSIALCSHFWILVTPFSKVHFFHDPYKLHCFL